MSANRFCGVDLDALTHDALVATGFTLVESYEADYPEPDDALLIAPNGKLCTLEAGKLQTVSIPESVEYSNRKNTDTTGGDCNSEGRNQWLRMVLEWKGEQ